MKTSTTKCPNCGKITHYMEHNEWRPFCSERCKLIDLGGWLSEAHRIPGDEPADDNLPGDDDLTVH